VKERGEKAMEDERGESLKKVEVMDTKEESHIWKD